MSISIWQLLIVFGIIILIFGTSKIKNIGVDLGQAIKNFKNAAHSNEDDHVDNKSTNNDKK